MCSPASASSSLCLLPCALNRNEASPLTGRHSTARVLPHLRGLFLRSHTPTAIDSDGRCHNSGQLEPRSHTPIAGDKSAACPIDPRRGFWSNGYQLDRSSGKNVLFERGHTVD